MFDSDFDALADEEHVCGEDCGPMVPLADLELEDLSETEHIDALYSLLNLVREHATLMLVKLADGESNVTIPGRTAALFLDLNEAALAFTLGSPGPYSVEDVLAVDVAVNGEEGYAGRARSAIFAYQLQTMDPDDDM